MKLSPNFHLDEFTTSQTAGRLGLDNTPPAEVLEHLKRTADRMENVRAFLANPILVTSGYRSPAVNRAIGGSKTSAHVQGYAVDFICPGFGDPLKVCKALAGSGLTFDQLIEEGSWVHLSFDPRGRRQVLTYRDGQYLPGLRA